jgi:hypothetical protein
MLRKLVWVFLPALACAQSYTASVRGTVTDPTHAAVPSASVTITDVERNVKRAAKTDGRPLHFYGPSARPLHAVVRSIRLSEIRRAGLSARGAVDFTLMKNFRFQERKSAQVRLESFNLTNTPTFGRPVENYGSDTFGQINGYAPGRSARQLQIAVKIYY